jgi:3-oxoadipate CoA-transferase, alpha subunit
MAHKVKATPREAVADIWDGATIMVGGFNRGQGIPYNLIDALIQKGVGNLTVIANNYNCVNDLVRERRVRKAIVSMESRATYDPRFAALRDAHIKGEVELEALPQGTLCQRIQAWGAGIAAFYTRVAVGTPIAQSKEVRTFDGEDYILERCLGADFALIKAHRGDTFGNLVYYKAARNINPTMAQGAAIVIAEVDKIVEAGELNPDTVVTSGIFINRIVEVRSKTVTFETRERK